VKPQARAFEAQGLNDVEEEEEEEEVGPR